MKEKDMFAHVTPEVWVKNEKDLLKNVESLWNMVPLVNISDINSLPDQRLVKFRGMVQDTLNVEYYLDQYEVYDKVTNETKTKTTKFMDEIVYDVQCEVFSLINPDHVYALRHVYVGIAIPGFNAWGRNIERNLGLAIGPSPTAKRSIDHVEMSMDEASSTSGSKKQCMSQAPTDQKTFPYPVPAEDPNLEKKCFLILYENTNALKVTDLVEVVGFVSRTEGPIVRIHCVTFKKLDHCNLTTCYTPLVQNQYPSYKNDLHFVLTQLMLGDELAAEYLIYHLISRIYTRNDVFPIGKFCLNISQVPPSILNGFGKGVNDFIELIVPASKYVPMTIENLNTLSFCTNKDYETDTLKTGILQVARNTHIVLDETKLEAGQLNESGIKAINALSNAIVLQSIAYDCLNYSVNMDCDIPFLTISEGKSLLPSDHRVCLQPDQTCLSVYPDSQEAAKRILQNFVYDLRLYLTQARHQELQFSDDIMEVIQNDFVRLRQTRSFVADDLHRLLVLSRLIAISDGKSTLDVDSWRKACKLDKERASRIESV
uniref:Mini-chromosome maintenance complex-binding protein n=1 Tax=Photinus pyralis TaxID=7054 RepID=A0A1Y1KGV7_PHOPY